MAQTIARAAPRFVPTGPRLAPRPIADIIGRSGFTYQPRKAKDAFIPSPQQTDVFDAIEYGTGNYFIEAVAGSGKTTTLVRGKGLMKGTVFLCAFNTAIADELKVKVAEQKLDMPGDRVSTIHSYGFAQWRRRAPKVRRDPDKLRGIIDMHIQRGESSLKVLQGWVAKVIRLAKQYLIGVTTEASDAKAWDLLIERFNLDDDLPEGFTIETALRAAQTIMAESVAMMAESIDYDDMIYAPLLYRVKMDQYDNVVVDEGQDLSPARLELARRALKPNGRFFGVGDSRQAIYAFAGAAADSVEQIKAVFNAKTLPLTYTRRCPKKVVAYVHQWVSHIQAHPDAPEGEVRAPRLQAGLSGVDGEPAPWFLHETPDAASAILCRKNKPLVKTAYGLIRAGIPCRIEGRDIGKGLTALARKWKGVKTIEGLMNRLGKWLAGGKKMTESARQDAEDKVETIGVFAERCRALGLSTVAELCAEIDRLFADDIKGVITLCSGHKAKGREWDTVYILQTSPINKPMQDWEYVQEDNLRYVMGTRAKATLVLVPEDEKKD